MLVGDIFPLIKTLPHPPEMDSTTQGSVVWHPICFTKKTGFPHILRQKMNHDTVWCIGIPVTNFNFQPNGIPLGIPLPFFFDFLARKTRIWSRFLIHSPLHWCMISTITLDCPSSRVRSSYTITKWPLSLSVLVECCFEEAGSRASTAIARHFLALINQSSAASYTHWESSNVFLST